MNSVGPMRTEDHYPEKNPKVYHQCPDCGAYHYPAFDEKEREAD